VQRCNKNAIELLKENIDLINWINLCFNKNAIELLRENPEKINWDFLSMNSNAMDLLKENQDKINWSILTKNKGIFRKHLDTNAIASVSKALNIHLG
jgi:hypothetical protein